MPQLITPFKKIAQSGPCADGRNIDPQWLIDMAETYAPALYTARIWPEHVRWGNNYGKVVALETRDENGLVALYAQLAPNAFYVWDNQFDQMLNFSIEVQENFAQSGRAYLVGLGITNSPASLGTDELKFSARTQSGGSVHVFSNVPAVPLGAAEPEPGWFASFRKSFSKPQPHEDTMTPELFAALSGRVDALQATMDGLKAEFTATMAQGNAHGAAPAASPADPATAPAQAAPQADFAQALTPVLAGLESLAAQMTTMNQRFAAPKPGTAAPLSTGPADDAAPLL